MFLHFINEITGDNLTRSVTAARRAIRANAITPHKVSKIKLGQRCNKQPNVMYKQVTSEKNALHQTHFVQRHPGKQLLGASTSYQDDSHHTNAYTYCSSSSSAVGFFTFASPFSEFVSLACKGLRPYLRNEKFVQLIQQERNGIRETAGCLTVFESTPTHAS